MKLIIGLGNPGKKYETTRHNAGFIFLDQLKSVWNFPEFQMNGKFDSEISESNKDNEKHLLVKPQAFMNNSGTATKKLMVFYKLEPEDIIVIHDDLDIIQGKYKISEDSRSAGHNGVQDIIEQLGTQQFRRIRIGIAKTPEEKSACQLSGKDYVLENFSQEELEKLDSLSKEIIEKNF